MRHFPLSVRTTGILLCALAAAPAAGCGGDDPQAALDKFEANRVKSQIRMNQVEARYASCELPADRAASEAFAEAWQEQWEDIESEVKKLKKELARVVKSLEKHFKKMNEMAETITAPDLKATELAKNAELHRRWTATMTEANANVKKMDEQVSAAKDIYKVLKLASMRAHTENKIAEIRHLNKQIKVTVADLEKVTAEGRALVR